MSIRDDIRPITFLKNHASDLLAQINETHRPVVITQNGEPKAVLLDPDSYEQTRQALGVLKLLAAGEEDVRAGRTISQEQVFSQLRHKLDELGHARKK